MLESFIPLKNNTNKNILLDFNMEARHTCLNSTNCSQSIFCKLENVKLLQMYAYITESYSRVYKENLCFLSFL